MSLASKTKRAAMAVHNYTMSSGGSSSPALKVQVESTAPQRTVKIPPKNSIGGSINQACLVSINEKSDYLILTENPLVIGRSSDLPATLLPLIQSDNYISREHCKIWIKPENSQLYVEVISHNGLTLEGQLIKKDERVKIDFIKPITLVLGNTKLIISPA
jgi:hypothetical protein